MKGGNDRRKAVSLLDLAMRLRDLEARAKQRLSCRRSEAHNQFRLDGFQFCFQPWRLRSQRKETHIKLKLLRPTPQSSETLLASAAQERAVAEHQPDIIPYLLRVAFSIPLLSL